MRIPKLQTPNFMEYSTTFNLQRIKPDSSDRHCEADILAEAISDEAEELSLFTSVTHEIASHRYQLAMTSPYVNP
jgi:hypothetical protein